MKRALDQMENCGVHHVQHCQSVKGRDCPTLFCTGPASPRALFAVLARQYRKDIKLNLFESVQKRLTKMVKALNKMCEEWLKSLAFLVQRRGD